MGKIIDSKSLEAVIDDDHKKAKKIVLVGGCFDLLHTGHLRFLEKAREQGDTLYLLLESDIGIKKRKGDMYPIHEQSERAILLSGLIPVDIIICLPDIMTDNDYDLLVKKIRPGIIATTKQDPGRVHKLRQANSVGAKVIDVIDRIPHKSSSRLAHIIQEQFDL